MTQNKLKDIEFDEELFIQDVCKSLRKKSTS